MTNNGTMTFPHVLMGLTLVGLQLILLAFQKVHKIRVILFLLSV